MKSTKASFLSNDRRSAALRAGVYITFIESCVHRRRHMAASRAAEQKKVDGEQREKGDKETGMEKEGAAY